MISTTTSWNRSRQVMYGLTLTAALLAAAGCSSTSAAPPNPDRGSPRAVADAYAAALGAGDWAAACALTTGQLHTAMVNQAQCSGQAGWAPQQPRVIHACPNKYVTGGYQLDYQYDNEVNRFFILSLSVAQTAGQWSVTGTHGSQPGEQQAWCDGFPAPAPGSIR